MLDQVIPSCTGLFETVPTTLSEPDVQAESGCPLRGKPTATASSSAPCRSARLLCAKLAAQEVADHIMHLRTAAPGISGPQYHQAEAPRASRNTRVACNSSRPAVARHRHAARLNGMISSSANTVELSESLRVLVIQQASAGADGGPDCSRPIRRLSHIQCARIVS